ncbi:hypothetical protein [Ramlibacter humi]|uniref:hypothetical protein n=1 Tax=Ramlibacter humi TaxID=2530451 RepID=UPI00142F9E86|nr:hypothetical protein [Ramlibacter humi]
MKYRWIAAALLSGMGLAACARIPMADDREVWGYTGGAAVALHVPGGLPGTLD